MNQEELLALVAKGKDAWNKWVEANPETEVNFSGIVFEGEVSFRGFTFPKETTFSSATFSGHARFDSATFSGHARFDSATFSGYAGFDSATFSDDAWFGGATFSSYAWFGGATFSSNARFGGATFSDDAWFGGATFSDHAWFDSATFSGNARFGGATFSGYAGFDSATFSGNTRFDSATFSDYARFGGATFSGNARFNSVTLGNAWFDSATFSGNAWFDSATFSGDARFGGATFSGDARFDSIDVNVKLDFNGSQFHDIPDFRTAKNRDRIALENVVFSLPEPTEWLSKVVSTATGIQGSNEQTAFKIRQLRGIASDTNAIDTERELTILERNAQLGADWALLQETTYVKNTKSNSRTVPATEIQWYAKFFVTLFQTTLMLAYRWTSRYGRSVVVPVAWLFGIFFFYKWRYGHLYDKVSSNYKDAKNISASLFDYTITSMVPFGSNVRPTYQVAINDLFRPIAHEVTEGRVPANFQLWSLSQGVLTLTFLFLIGLALRNFFRMK